MADSQTGQNFIFNHIFTQESERGVETPPNYFCAFVSGRTNLFLWLYSVYLRVTQTTVPPVPLLLEAEGPLR